MLEIVGLEKAFGSVYAVRGVNLAIPDGEFFSLLGPSGCGKTTLLRMLGGFESPTAGEIRQDYVRIDTLPANQRHFNMVFQRYALFPHLSVRENVAFGLKMKRVPRAEIRARVAEMLALVKMEGMEERAISTLSGGQQQRVALARALVNRPRVLLLDEPLSALDLKLRQQMQVELRAIQRRIGHSFIFVTHDQEEALTLSDRIAVMNCGRIEQVGTPEEIYENPKTAFVAKFIGSINSWRGKLAEASAHEATVRTAEGQLIRVRPSRDGSRGIAGFGVGEGVDVLLRPEKIRISPAGNGPGAAAAGADGGENRVQGVLKEILYQGAVTLFVVETEASGAGPSVLVSQPNTALQSQADFSVMDKVVLSWSPQDCVLLRAPEIPAADAPEPGAVAGSALAVEGVG